MNGRPAVTSGTRATGAVVPARDNLHMSRHARPQPLPARRRAGGRGAVRRSLRGQAGFTLIELAIAVAIVALLASIALPGFLDSLRKSRRSEAFAALTAVQQAQERWRANNATYSADLTGQLQLPAVTAKGNYAIAITAATATGHTVQATVRGGQAGDTACAVMALQAVAGTIRYGSASADGSLSEPLSDPKRCWSQQ